MKIGANRWHQTYDYGRFDPPPTTPGCYAIFMCNYKFNDLLTPVQSRKPMRKKLIYIGTSINLAYRLKKHSIANRKTNNCFMRIIKIRSVDNERERLRLEKSLIMRLKPILNKEYRYATA